MTVGEVRKAIEGLPDEAFVSLHYYQPVGVDETETRMIFAQLNEVRREGDRLVFQMEVNVLNDGDDDDGDLWDDSDTDDL